MQPQFVATGKIDPNPSRIQPMNRLGSCLHLGQ